MSKGAKRLGQGRLAPSGHLRGRTAGHMRRVRDRLRAAPIRRAEEVLQQDVPPEASTPPSIAGRATAPRRPRGETVWSTRSSGEKARGAGDLNPHPPDLQSPDFVQLS